MAIGSITAPNSCAAATCRVLGRRPPLLQAGQGTLGRRLDREGTSARRGAEDCPGAACGCLPPSRTGRPTNRATLRRPTAFAQHGVRQAHHPGGTTEVMRGIIARGLGLRCETKSRLPPRTEKSHARYFSRRMLWPKVRDGSTRPQLLRYARRRTSCEIHEGPTPMRPIYGERREGDGAGFPSISVRRRPSPSRRPAVPDHTDEIRARGGTGALRPRRREAADMPFVRAFARGRGPRPNPARALQEAIRRTSRRATTGPVPAPTARASPTRRDRAVPTF